MVAIVTLQYLQEANRAPFKRARAVAQWELGDFRWADAILAAYFDPDDERAAEARAELTADDLQ